MTEDAQRKRLIPDKATKKIDQKLRQQLAGVTRGLSPIDIAAAVMDWAGHMALSPGKMLSLAESAVRNGIELGNINASSMLRSEDGVAPVADRRMQAEEWQRWPFNVLAHAHRLAKEFASEATTDVDGVPAGSRAIRSLPRAATRRIAVTGEFPADEPRVSCHHETGERRQCVTRCQKPRGRQAPQAQRRAPAGS